MNIYFYWFGGGGKEWLPSKIIFNQFSRHIVVNFGYSTLMFPKMWRVGVKSKGDPWIKRLYSMQEACMVFSASEKWKRHVSEVSTKLMTLQTYDVFSINLVIVNNILFLSFLNISFDNTYSIIMSWQRMWVSSTRIPMALIRNCSDKGSSKQIIYFYN